MEKANIKMSLSELKQFIRRNNLNKTCKPDLLLTQTKGNLIKGLIKHGYWSDPPKPKERVIIRYKIENQNFHELTLYVKRSDSTELTRWFYIEPYGDTKFKAYDTLQYVYILPQLEVNDIVTNESPNNIEESVLRSKRCVHKINLHSIYNNWKEELNSITDKLQDKTLSDNAVIEIQSDISAYMKTNPLITIKPHNYAPPKSELEQWKEVALKSNYLLQQMIKLGGMKYPNLEPILDMVQDIRIPAHTENDKEVAGIPSGLTNITQVTSIGE